MSMLTFGKTATPSTAATVTVPARVPAGEFGPMDNVTLVVAPVTVLPSASCIVTTTDGLIGLAAITFNGSAVKESLAAVAGVVLSEHAPAISAAVRTDIAV